MRKWRNLRNFRQQLFVLSAVAVLILVAATIARADSGTGLVPSSGAEVETGNGIVKGQHSNVRSRPSLNAEVIAQLHKGDGVNVLERKTVTEREKPMDWLRIALPSTAKCFVSAKHLSDGVTSVDNLNVHCGPGSSYREIGKLPKGTRVEVVTKKGEWVQIRPTAECTGWIAAELVDVQPAPRAQAPAPSVIQNGSEIVTPPVAITPAAPPATVVNTDPDVLVTYVVKDGYIGPVGETNAPASFELRTAEEDRLSFRVAYLEATDTNLKKYEGKHVRIAGTQRWRKGERYPVIALERVDMIW